MNQRKTKKWNDYEVDFYLQDTWIWALNQFPNAKLCNICSGHEIKEMTTLGGDQYPGMVLKLEIPKENKETFLSQTLVITEKLNQINDTWAEVEWHFSSDSIIEQDYSGSRYFKDFQGQVELPTNIMINGVGKIHSGRVESINLRIKSKLHFCEKNFDAINCWWENLIVHLKIIFG
ncbi:MAG: hypothetical protein A2381_07745 [Bdellovibrionales bacterium RIFOXYB1_FULL_37_110]|nr:MAG: hypothetical protein A2181_04510 [Bdellovibrionales bacterium RIFOXYA1_FULL_38_20]OFZ52498.1 MAG: hypothetical protein A2417_00465 [Bdellovibrionales bacterium RIFOXYC1_FULL_37_79]OFZ59700.1 MAG: hypothetical protein A2381_07745 [Bdellovibrionales bacterium RIFOXYB1_FULL_37_110]OFZ62627.1 MAG: hypothetical protein A2577_12065 [Bdellovibrionales bacterium RIFOXYD1_FULL_36_51]